MDAQGTDALLSWAVAARSAAGETDCGDRHLVAAFQGGLLVAVVDGLGHGVEAADAAKAATSELAASPGDAVDVLLRRCHAVLRRSRGAAISLASIRTCGLSASSRRAAEPSSSVSDLDLLASTRQRGEASSSLPEGELCWVGVGNVEMALLFVGPGGGAEHLLVQGGIVGQSLPKLRPRTVRFPPGTLLAAATDGIPPGLGSRLERKVPPAEAARRLLEGADGRDDALVLVGRLHRAEGGA